MFTIVTGFYLSQATFDSGNVWVPAYIHAILNGYVNFTLTLVTFNDSVINFRSGIYGLAILGVIVLGVIFKNRNLWEASAREHIKLDKTLKFPKITESN